MAARGPELKGGSNLCQTSDDINTMSFTTLLSALATVKDIVFMSSTSVSRLANLSNDCQMDYPLLFRSKKLWKIAQGLSEEAQCIQVAILNCTSWFLPSSLSASTLSGR